ncbi:recombinase family protein [Chitinophaga terrae (ex Kim and Jung 2007)]|uniref:recombinase family protein n=1 Tax=Chitinophaga terrae (ex Kim and Jung 2007) TaxID=408074 RepID=UPI0027D8EC1F|nr:recombinase family protein [Chitinophaga terrae (ex Kim and Jung 2007)]
MKKNIIIYIRVSTDEQARSGFSPNHQEMVIKAYCKAKGYNIIQIVREDYSAKTFNRPEWLKIMTFIKTNKKSVDAIVCLRWDRFSRNLEESLRVLRQLREMGVTLETVEQPLDMDNPDSKVMLSLYLTMPEVENDKNAIRTKEASRRSRLEGFWTGTAPFGYSNCRTAADKSTLTPNEDAPLVTEAFEMMATGVYSAEEVRKRLRGKGIKHTKQAFLNMLRNVVYIGKINVAEYKKEDAQIVLGVHPPIVKEETFRRVQNVLDGRRPNFKFGTNRTNIYPLRQYVKCPNCGRGLTAGGSRSRNGAIHHYYNCINNKCKVRHKIDVVHSDFDTFLASNVVADEIQELYYYTLEDVFKQDDAKRLEEINLLNKQAELIEKRIKKAEDDYYDSKIPFADYTGIKERYVKELMNIMGQIADKQMEKTPFKKYLSFGLSVVGNLQHYYKQAPVEVAQKLLGSIFPEKLTYEKNTFRTTKPNEVFTFMTSNIKGFEELKNKKVGKIADQSSMAPPAGLEPATL